MLIPFGAEVEFLPQPVYEKGIDVPKYDPKCRIGVMMGYFVHPGGKWSNEYIVADIKEFVDMDFRIGWRVTTQRVKRIVNFNTAERPLRFPLKATFDRANRTLEGLSKPYLSDEPTSVGIEGPSDGTVLVSDEPVGPRAGPKQGEHDVNDDPAFDQKAEQDPVPKPPVPVAPRSDDDVSAEALEREFNEESKLSKPQSDPKSLPLGVKVGPDGQTTAFGLKATPRANSARPDDVPIVLWNYSGLSKKDKQNLRDTYDRTGSSFTDDPAWKTMLEKAQQDRAEASKSSAPPPVRDASASSGSGQSVPPSRVVPVAGGDDIVRYSRYDRNASHYQSTEGLADAPPWDVVLRRVTYDMHTNEVLHDVTKDKMEPSDKSGVMPYIRDVRTEFHFTDASPDEPSALILTW